MSRFPLPWRAAALRVPFAILLILLPVLAVQAAPGDAPLRLQLPPAASVTTASPPAAPRTHAGPALSLDEAARLAAARAPQVQASQYRSEAAREDAVRAGRLPDPRLVAGLSNLPVTGPQAFNAAAEAMTMRTVGVMQEIPSHAKREAQRRLARAGVQLADAGETRLRLATRQMAASAWVTLWASERERDLLTDLRGQADVAVKASKARLTGGAGSATDALATRSDAEALDNRIDAADAEVAAARAGLERWLGQAADRPLGDAPDFSTLRVPEAQLQAKLDRQGPLLAWDAREDQADAAVAMAKSGKRPDWSVSLMYGHRSHRSDMLGIQFGLRLPLFPGNRQDRDISARYAERAAIRADHEDARRAQREAIAQAVASWQGWTRQVRRYREDLLPLAADRSRTALALYRGGGSLQPWLDARRDEIRIRIDYARALSAWGKAWVALAFLLPDHDLPELPQ